MKMKNTARGDLWKKRRKDLWRRLMEDDIASLGAQLSYSFLFAFFPFLIFVITVLGFSSINAEEVLAGVRSIVPLEVFKLVERTISEVMNNKSFKLLSFGILTAVFTASNGFLAVIKGLNKAYDVKEQRGVIKVEIIALSCTVILTLIIVISFILLIFGEINGNLILNHFGLGLSFKNAWNYFRYLVVIIIMMFIFASIYYFIPCRKLTWKEVIPGAIFTSIGWIICSEAFSYYVNKFSNYSMLYGSIGAVIILMTWLFLISILLLVGGEINATLSLCKECK
jgi:membrane protein